VDSVNLVRLRKVKTNRTVDKIRVVLTLQDEAAKQNPAVSEVGSRMPPVDNKKILAVAVGRTIQTQAMMAKLAILMPILVTVINQATRVAEKRVKSVRAKSILIMAVSVATARMLTVKALGGERPQSLAFRKLGLPMSSALRHRLAAKRLRLDTNVKLSAHRITMISLSWVS
jgi:hypothetical protein